MMTEDELNTLETLQRERDMLAEAIADAALKSGLYNGEVPLTGPHLLMFCLDMADIIIESDHMINVKSDWINSTLNDMAFARAVADHNAVAYRWRYYPMDGETERPWFYVKDQPKPYSDMEIEPLFSEQTVKSLFNALLEISKSEIPADELRKIAKDAIDNVDPESNKKD